MCEFCTKHGDGRIWYKSAENYAQDLVSDLSRRLYIENFFSSTIQDGFSTLGRLEALHSRKGRLPDAVIKKMAERAKTEHFGQVLPIEEIRDLVMKADTIVRMPCACRWASEKKEERCCYAISLGAEAWYKDLDMGYFGKASNEGLEAVSKADAMLQMEGLESHGAIHTIWTLMTPFIGSICNCTVRECLGMRTLMGIGVETIARAEYFASADEGLCSGCGACATTCQFKAIDMKYESGTYKARIDTSRCYGCGLCRRVCEISAISMGLRG